MVIGKDRRMNVKQQIFFQNAVKIDGISIILKTFWKMIGLSGVLNNILLYLWLILI